MDERYLLLLAVAVILAIAAVAVIRGRAARATEPRAGDSPFGVSTEGMKICPRCAMGNLWTERTCSACGERLRG